MSKPMPRSKPSILRGALLALIGALGLAAACSSSGSEGTATAGSGDGGTGTGDGGGGDLVFVLPDGGPPMVPAGCVDISVKGEKLPTDLYVMMDSSESMLQPTASGPSKWEAVGAALEAFFAQPTMTGIGVGLQFFPRIIPEAMKECLSEDACGAYGPCWGLRACSGLDYIERCVDDKGCQAGQTCQPMGYCHSTREFCVPEGSPCGAGGADTCRRPIKGDCLGRDSCAASDYAAPAVPVAPVPEGAPALTAALRARKPDGYTPTEAALEGALAHARARALAAPDRKQAVVLATDGLPTTCGTRDIAGVAAVARKAAAESPPIKTFVIGVFAPNEAEGAGANLQQLATAGGTAPAHIVSTDRDVTKSFLAALDAVRTATIGCEIKMPSETAKGKVDYGNVNIRFISGGGQEATIGYVAEPGRCHPTFGGWYYDVSPSRGTPTMILTCPRTCDLLRSDPQGKLEILVGCATIYVE
jgi:hypothetical protein